MNGGQERANAAPGFVVLGVIGLVLGGMSLPDEPVGWVFVGVGGSLFNAGLIGIAVNGLKIKPLRGEYPNPLRRSNKGV